MIYKTWNIFPLKTHGTNQKEKKKGKKKKSVIIKNIQVKLDWLLTPYCFHY